MITKVEVARALEVVARGRQNWTRWVSLVVVIGGMLQALWESETRFSIDPIAASAYYFILVVWAIAISFLFRRDAADWFNGSGEPTGVS